ncbi:MAG TPA: dihydrolipoamide acetyltransferase family protein [Streptosporangiaceae bacterium]|nr:dihydrolipoamide acetyltransferase family protein [Streptosporangiaceae bacterium]
MPSLLRMPEVAANTPEATVLAWVVSENTPYATDDPIVTVETAKATIDVEAEDSGVILKTLVTEGSDVKVGEPIALIGAPGEKVDDIPRALAELGVGTGQRPAAPSGQLPGEAPTAPLGQAPAAPPGQAPAAPPGQAPAAPARPEVSRDSNGGVSAAAGDGERIFASPLARRLAREASLDIREIVGTGPNNRIIRRDVDEAIRRHQAAPDAAEKPTVEGEPPAGAGPATDVAVPAGTEQREPSAQLQGFWDEPHSRLRRAIAASLTHSKQTAPHFYLSGVAEVDKLLRMRSKINDESAVRVSLNDLLVKAVARAHTVVPRMNVIWTHDAVRHFTTVDVAVAVATDQGLVTPVLRDVDRTNLSAIARATKDFAERARAGRLQQHELEGGTITVTNLGMFGTSEFTAIINPPQAAILAVGASTPAPVVKKGKLKVATTLRVTLSVDHRPVDGVIAAEWMREFLSLLEHPLQILT